MTTTITSKFQTLQHTLVNNAFNVLLFARQKQSYLFYLEPMIQMHSLFRIFKIKYNWFVQSSNVVSCPSDWL